MAQVTRLALLSVSLFMFSLVATQTLAQDDKSVARLKHTDKKVQEYLKLSGQLDLAKYNANLRAEVAVLGNPKLKVANVRKSEEKEITEFVSKTVADSFDAAELDRANKLLGTDEGKFFAKKHVEQQKLLAKRVMDIVRTNSQNPTPDKK